MGFFDAMKKMAQGKPVFEVSDANNRQTDTSGQDSTGGGNRIHRGQRLDDRGNKVIPEATFFGVEPRYSGEYMQLWVSVRNDSPHPVFLDKCYIFGVKQELDYPLQPGGMREFMIYSGKLIRNDSYKYAELYYRDDESGDYFCAAHVIQYNHQSDGTYDIVGLDLIRPIKDV